MSMTEPLYPPDESEYDDPNDEDFCEIEVEDVPASGKHRMMMQSSIPRILRSTSG
ncbi:uncharacterized protein PITG_16849 [Phytophthora infestans T30-4]|uniref:Uncharacterized protein n=1 Tax=Phytophthora infestans (strain T30-4) TaxID=403677 RepID=D0NU90_PHYIT|nr:uncharacterized protein PITG_16849 [Phytophthora infestans T30-4]EEY65223.1 hypothetical protein PITG_16849 [Phytophthora infestans T30-4]|eukprot:XP_002897287.1 hypothetical protein PITG_16849 [Phytophthora infestans T30-4]